MSTNTNKSFNHTTYNSVVYADIIEGIAGTVAPIEPIKAAIHINYGGGRSTSTFFNAFTGEGTDTSIISLHI